MTDQQKLNRETELKIAQMGVNDAILQQMMASQQPVRDGFDVVVHVVNRPTGTYIHL